MSDEKELRRDRALQLAEAGDLDQAHALLWPAHARPEWFTCGYVLLRMLGLFSGIH